MVLDPSKLFNQSHLGSQLTFFKVSFSNLEMRYPTLSIKAKTGVQVGVQKL